MTGRLLARLFDFLTLLVLARLLTPEDFGTVAVAMTLLYIVEALLEMPVNQAIVRLSVVQQSHLDTAFTLALIRGVAIASIIIALAWPYAAFNHDDRLVGLLCALSIAPAIRALSSPRLAMFSRNLDFRPDCLLDFCGKSAAFVTAGTVAVLHGHYWALAAATIAGPVVATIISYIVAPYRPRLTLVDSAVFTNLLLWNTANQFLSAFIWQIDRLVLGRYSPREQLGHYTVATDLASLPNQSLIGMFWRPSIAAFASVQHDPQRLASAYTKTLSAILMTGAPLLVGLGLLSGPIVTVLLGPAWGATASLLSIFCISRFIVLFGAPLSACAIALNRSEANAVLSLMILAVKLPLTLIGYQYYGINGVLAAVIAGDVVLAVGGMLIGGRLAGVTMTDQLFAAWRPLAACLAMAVAIVMTFGFLQDVAPGLELAIKLASAIAFGGTVYVACLFALWKLSGEPDGADGMIFEFVLLTAAKLFRRTAS